MAALHNGVISFVLKALETWYIFGSDPAFMFLWSAITADGHEAGETEGRLGSKVGAETRSTDAEEAGSFRSRRLVGQYLFSNTGIGGVLARVSLVRHLLLRLGVER